MRTVLLVLILFFPACLACNISISTECVFDKKITFRPYSSSDFVTYWVEDLNGNIVKPKRNTTHFTKKSFTPEDAGVYVIKASSDGCSSSKNIYFHKEKKVSWVIREFPDIIYNNKEFTLRVEVFGQGEEIEMWSHVYRGSKCYSESIKHNLQRSLVNGSYFFRLKDKIDVEPGNYSLMVSDSLQNQLSREITVKDVKKVSISNMSYNNNLRVVVRNDFEQKKAMRLEIESPFRWKEKNITLLPGDTEYTFDIETSLEKNPVFAKLYDKELIDVKEIIIYQPKKEIIFKNVYKSPGQKTKEWAVYFVLCVSVILNLYLLFSGSQKHKS